MLVESSPNALLMLDQHGTITLMNRQGELLFGYKREELVGKPVEILIPDRVRGRHAALRNGTRPGHLREDRRASWGQDLGGVTAKPGFGILFHLSGSPESAHGIGRRISLVSDCRSPRPAAKRRMIFISTDDILLPPRKSKLLLWVNQALIISEEP
jgi:PAS domain-containing protein